MNFRKEKYQRWIGSSEICKKDFNVFLEKQVIVRIEENKLWSRRYMDKADHNMDFATIVTNIHKDFIKERFQNKTFYDWTTIAYYYAVYHAALSLLANSGYKSRSHIATLCGVIYYYYHKNKDFKKKHIDVLRDIDKENIDQFIETQNLRERASYGISISFEERLAEIAKNDAIEFLNKSKNVLRRR